VRFLAGTASLFVVIFLLTHLVYVQVVPLPSISAALVRDGLLAIVAILLFRESKRRVTFGLPALRFERRSMWELLLVASAAVLIVATISLASLLYGVSIGTDSSNVHRFIGVIGSALSIAIYEEIIFRGLLLALFCRMVGMWRGVVICAMLFAFAHFDGRSSILLLKVFVAGFVFTALLLAFRSLWVPIGAHFGYNIAVIAQEGTREFQVSVLPRSGNFGAFEVALVVGLCMTLFVLCLFGHRSIFLESKKQFE
jgi:membrane protease YdiL (CAAX protease family)